MPSSRGIAGVRRTELMRIFQEALRLVKNISDEAGSSDSACTRTALGVTHLGNAVPPSAKKHYVLLDIAATAARTRS